MYHLLIVDDEYFEIEALSYIVKEAQLPFNEIATASSGRQAVNLAKSFQPDIVLMDIKMPGISGIEAAALIKEALPNCKVVFLSAYNYFHYAQEAIRLEANDFLIKPVSNDQLIDVLKRLITSIESEKNNREITSSIESQFKQISAFFENELINYLLFADVKRDQLAEYFHVLNCTPETIHSLVVSLDDASFDDLSPLQATMMKRRCIKTIKEALYPHAYRCLGNFNKNWIYLIALTHHPMPKCLMKEEAIQIQEAIYRHYHFKARVAVGQGTENTMSLTPYILGLKHQLLFNNTDDLIIYPETSKASSNKFSAKKEHMLLEAVSLNNTTAILSIASDYCTWLKEGTYTIEEIRYHLFGMISYIIKSLSQTVGMDQSKLIDFHQSYIKKLMDNNNTDTLFSCFTDQLLTIASLIDADMAPVDSPVISKLCEYIQDHYMDNLCLKDLSDDFNMNSQYLSKHFKEIIGITFSEFLTDVRMSKAKSLLAETNEAIQVISESVGYNDPNYFTRAFKKECSMTPIQYRQKASLRHKNPSILEKGPVTT